jgi:hypothetical protein
MAEQMPPHPSGMPANMMLASRWDAIEMCRISGGIASLNHRLMAANPPGSKPKTSRKAQLQKAPARAK